MLPLLVNWVSHACGLIDAIVLPWSLHCMIPDWSNYMQFNFRTLEPHINVAHGDCGYINTHYCMMIEYMSWRHCCHCYLTLVDNAYSFLNEEKKKGQEVHWVWNISYQDGHAHTVRRLAQLPDHLGDLRVRPPAADRQRNQETNQDFSKGNEINQDSSRRFKTSSQETWLARLSHRFSSGESRSYVA